MSSGVALVIAGHPFDTVKVRLQTQGAGGRFQGPLDCVKQTLAKEGFRGLYKGAAPPLAMTGFVNSIMFGLQAQAVRAVVGGSHRAPTTRETMQAAVLSGFAVSIVVQPMEAIKARLQIQYGGAGDARRFTGPIDCLKQVVRTLGVRRGLYRGWTLTALCRMSNWAYFGTYELCRKQLGLTSGSSGGRSLAQSIGASVLCGAAAGFSYWLSCYPLDVIKNRLQTAPDVHPPLYKNGWECAKIIFRTQGWRGFTVGFLPCILRSVPANAAAFTAYELTIRALPHTL